MSRAPSAAGEHAMLQPLRDESRQLDPAVRMSMERSMGASFGDVVVHTGEASGEAAEGLDAAAFTVGRHVVFGPGRYDPSSLRGRMLLAHELEHVVQQQRGGGDPDLGERAPASALPVHTGDSEGHARTAAQAALGGSTVAVGATLVGVARQTKAEEARTAAAARSPEQVRRGLREGLRSVADWARYMRAEHERTLDETSASSLSDFADMDRLWMRGIGVYSDIVAGVTPPDPGMWGAVATPVENGLAALDKDDLKDAAFWLKSAMAQLTTGLQTWDEYCQARIGAAGRTADKLKPAATVGRGVLGAVSQLSLRLAGMIDTIIWLDTTGQPSPPDSLGRRAATELGLINPRTGRPALTPTVESFYASTRTYLYQGQEDPLFGAFEGGELIAAVVEELALPATGPVAAAVVAVDVATAIRTVAESVEACTDRRTGKVDVERLLGQESFWLSISQAALAIAGIQARSTTKRLTRFIVRYGSSLISGSQQLVELIEAFEARNTADGKKRFDRAARAFIKFLAEAAVRAAKQSGAERGHTKGGAAGDETPPAPRGASQKVSPQPQTGKPPDLATTKPATRAKLTPKQATESGGPAKVPAQPAAPAEGKAQAPASALVTEPAPTPAPAPKAAEPSQTAPPTTAAVKPPVTAPETETSAPPKTAPVKPPGSETSKAAAPAAKSAAKGKLTPKSATESESPAKTPVQPAAPPEGTAAPAPAPGKTKGSQGGGAKAPKKPSSAKKGSSPKKAPSAAKAAAEQATTGAKSGGKTKLGSKKPGGGKPAPATGPGPQAAEAPQASQGSKPSKSRAMTPEVKDTMKRARELTKRVAGGGDDSDKARGELQALYKKASDDALKYLARDKKLGADPEIQKEIDKRDPTRDEAEQIRSGKIDPPRMPHEATVIITTDDGKTVYHAVDDPNGKPGDPIKLEPAQKDLKSGGMKPERVKEVGYREASNEVHTEAKAVQLPLTKGQTMTIIGQYDPCNPCQARMQEKANSSKGTVIYWWPGGPKDGMRFTPKDPEKP